MTVRTGIDLIEIERVQAAIQRHGERFLERVFTPAERAYCAGRPASLAARFAAKEAAAKALGTGIGNVAWREIEVRQQAGGAPELVLHGRAALLAHDLGVREWSLSLSHIQGLAAAVVVGVG